MFYKIGFTFFQIPFNQCIVMYQTVQFLFYVELAFKHSGGQHAEKEFRIHIVFLVYMLQLVNPILHLVHLLYLMNVEVQRVNLIPDVLRLLHMCMLDFKNAFGMVDFVLSTPNCPLSVR